MATKTIRYFYLDGEVDGKIVPLLHKKLHINRGADTIIAWCYPLHRRVALTYSDVKKRMDPAFSTQEVAKMINRGRQSIEFAILDGNIEAPQFTYGLNEHKQKFKYMWHENDIMKAHAYFSTVHRGRPRKDGMITPQRLPTARELRAIIRNNEVLYVKVGDEFKPVWEAPDFD